MSPASPKTDFENEKYIIILYLFCTILYTESQILYTIPLRYRQLKFGGADDIQPPQMQFQHTKLDHNFVLI